MNKLVKEELNKMKYLLGYQRGMVISEQSGGLQLQSVSQGIQGVNQAVQGGLDAVKSQLTAPATAPAAAAAASQTVQDVVKKIQEILNTKYGAKLTVDGKWGNLTQTAFENAVKSKTAAPATSGTTLPTVTVTGATAPAAAIAAAPNVPLPAVNTPTAPGVSTQPVAAQAPVAAGENPEDIVGTEVAQPTRRDMRRDRQDLRRSNRRAMQDLRTQQRAQ